MAGQGGYSTLAVSLYLKLDYSFPSFCFVLFAGECECVASDKMLSSFFPPFFLVFIHPWWMTTYKALFALLSRLAARRLMLMEGEKSVWERKHPEPTMISSFHDEEEGKAKGACKEGPIDRQARQHIPLQIGCGTISHPLSLYCPTFLDPLTVEREGQKKKKETCINNKAHANVRVGSCTVPLCFSSQQAALTFERFQIKITFQKRSRWRQQKGEERVRSRDHKTRHRFGEWWDPTWI